MKKFFLLVAAAFAGISAMAYTLNNPIGEDGRYIVKYDCANHQFAASNDVEVDQTFVIAFDIKGTWLEDWLKEPATAAGASRGVAFNNWTNWGDTHGDFRRLMQIEGTIWGCTCNYAQLIHTFAVNEAFATMADSVTYVYAQFFGFEYTEVDPGAGWWMWNGNPDGTSQADGADCLFAFQPYTGAYTSNPLFVDDFEDLSVKGDIYGFDLFGYCAPGVDLEWNWEERGHLYILGNIQGIGWEPAASGEMDYVGQGCYAGVYTFEGSPAYFAFTTAQGSWDDVNANRFAGEANDLLTEKTPTKATGFGDNMCFTVAAGTYKVVFNYAQNTCTVISHVATGLENLSDNVQAEKLIENGQVVILKNGVRYNVLGAVVK